MLYHFIETSLIENERRPLLEGEEESTSDAEAVYGEKFHKVKVINRTVLFCNFHVYCREHVWKDLFQCAMI